MFKMRKQSPKLFIVGLVLVLSFTLPTVAAATTYSTTHARFIINAKTVSDPVILTGTSPGSMNPDVPLFNVIQIFRLMGINNQWARNVWSFDVTPKKSSQQSRLHIPGNGSVTIKVDGYVAGTIPCVVYRASSTETVSTYIPIDDVLDIARWIGVQSIWDGYNWINIYQAPLPKNTGPAYEKKITLNLVQKATNIPATADIPAVPPIYGVTHLALPLYPGAIPTSQKFSMAFAEVPISWYVRTGKAEYVASVDINHLAAWYEQHMQADAFRQTGSGTVGNYKTGESSQGFVFQPLHQPQGHQIEVDISFENLGKGKTLFEYWATDLVIPPRPVTNYLPNDVIEINGNMTVYGSKVTQYKVDIANAKQIQSLVTDANSLLHLIQGINPGGPEIWGTAQLTFHTSTGQAIQVNIDTDSVSVDGVGLQDYQGTVWKALELIMGINGPN